MRRVLRLLHVAHVVLHYALRNAAPLVVLVVLCLLALGIATEGCCGASGAGRSTRSCCSVGIDCEAPLGFFPFPGLRARAAPSGSTAGAHSDPGSQR
jgi:hypothetical protein